MHSLWNDDEALQYGTDLLAQRVYTSQLLGRDSTLVLHGGGNTSLKATVRNIFDDPEQILYIKGSGWDLATIGRGGFAPARLQVLQRLATLTTLSDTDMMRELKAACTDPAAPTPSVEAILHAIMPARFVDHTHADAVVAISNTANGEHLLREIYGEEVLILPYVMPGFILAQQVYRATRSVDWQKLKGIILLHHGIFTFHEDARQSYENMIELVSRAERFLQERNIITALKTADHHAQPEELTAVSAMRKQASNLYGKPMLARWDLSPAAIGYSSIPGIENIATRGPLTPDHTLHTKRTAMIVDPDTTASVVDFSRDYCAYFARHNNGNLTCLDSAPRVGVWKNRGMLYFAPNAKRLQVVQDIATHTQQAIQWAEQLGGWQALPENDIFELEYWELEQAKLKSSSTSPMFEGKIAVVTGAASGIGRACVDALVKQGACVAALDINADISSIFKSLQVSGIRCDVTSTEQLRAAIQTAIQQFGGIDVLISNAGLFPPSCEIEMLDDATLLKSTQLNYLSHAQLLRECIPFLKLGADPAVVMVASKNVPAPGPGALAYSGAKAALTQMARVAALELGPHGIRVNSVHPNAVFDTGIWDETTLQARATAYGLTVSQYKTNNVLRCEVNSAKVADAILALCSPQFSCTTGAQLPVDGGNERVI